MPRSFFTPHSIHLSDDFYGRRSKADTPQSVTPPPITPTPDIEAVFQFLKQSPEMIEMLAKMAAKAT